MGIKEKIHVLVIGLGSIGLRHASNLLQLGVSKLTLVTKRTDLPNEFIPFQRFSSLENALEEETYTHAVICSETTRHIHDLTQVIRAGIPQIYLEKPISHNEVGVEEILELLKEDQQVYLGFDLRFDKGLVYIHDLVGSNSFGKLLSAQSFVGQYLPDWRPHEDYRKGSSALKSKGGGVLLDLVHEFDFLYWLLGKVDRLAGVYQKNSILEIETEDIADVVMYFRSGTSATLHLDYHQKKLIRHCIFTFESGTATWDLTQRNVKLVNHSRVETTYDYFFQERNDRFLEVMKEFIENPENLATYSDGIESLKMVLGVKKSFENFTFVQL